MKIFRAGAFAAPCLWGILLALSGAIFSFTLACIVPFAAIATFAARGFSQRAAILVVLAAASANQAVGFLCNGYPRDPLTCTWGVVIAAASLAALFAARRVRELRHAPSPAGLPPPWLASLRASASTPALAVTLAFSAEFCAAFVSYQAVIFAFSAVTQALGGFTPAIVAQVAWVNVLGAVLLGGVNVLLLAAERQGTLRSTGADR